jgi:hypothetical protein
LRRRTAKQFGDRNDCRQNFIGVAAVETHAPCRIDHSLRPHSEHHLEGRQRRYGVAIRVVRRFEFPCFDYFDRCTIEIFIDGLCDNNVLYFPIRSDNPAEI